jgi:diacylglycerol kinase family enzyme
MQRLWFVSNVRSGTATHEKCEAIEAVVQEHGLSLAGRTRFPDDPLPDPATLDAARADTVMLFAGDGTINAALCKLAGWNGAVLILPGGTMNLLAKRLHSSLDPGEIVAVAHVDDRRIALPYVEAGEHRAFVAMIVGPATAWVHAREAARERRIARALRAAALAWRRSFGRGVRLEGAPPLRKRYQAVTVTADERGLAVAGIDARDWRALAELGWSWVTGEWMAARAVDTAHVRELRVPHDGPARCLFDGEPVTLEPGTAITAGRTRESFLTTAAA